MLQPSQILAESHPIAHMSEAYSSELDAVLDGLGVRHWRLVLAQGAPLESDRSCLAARGADPDILARGILHPARGSNIPQKGIIRSDPHGGATEMLEDGVRDAGRVDKEDGLAR